MRTRPKLTLKLPERPVRRLVGSIHAHPYVYFVVCLLLTAVMLSFGRSLKLKSKIQDLLPESAPSVQAMEVLQRRLGSADILVITLMSHDFEPVRRALPKIAAALRAHPDVSKVVWQQDMSLIDRNALTIFPTLKELENYHDELTDTIREAVKGKLALFDDEPTDEAPAEQPIRRTYSWGEFENDDGLSSLGRTFRKKRGDYPKYFYNRDYTAIALMVYPTQPSGDLAFCRHILKALDQLVRVEVERHLGSVGEGHLVQRVDLGGGYRDALEQSKQIENDMASSITFALVLLCLVVILFFRSLRGLVCVMLPLIMGTAWLVGVVTLTIGYLNLITAFIFAVLLGLGIDFSIHFYARYREERAAGREPLEAMVQTHLHCGEASILAATTTSAAFLALTFADFRGFSQFGGVAAAGVVLCLLAVLIVFPAITFIFERWMPLRLLGYRVARDQEGEIRRDRFPLGPGTVVVTVLLAVGGIVLGLRDAEFELDFRKLGERVKTEKAEYKKVQHDTGGGRSPAVIFATSAEEARSLYDQLEAKIANGTTQIKSFQSLFTLVPTDQKEKQRLVARICRKLRRKVKLFEGDQRDGADELLRHCDPTDFEVSDLPDWVLDKFTDRDGRVGEIFFVTIVGSNENGEDCLAFREEMSTLKGLDGSPPLVSGKPMIWADVLIAMKRDGLLTSVASLAVVLVLLLIFERRLVAVGIVFLPLGIALGISAGLIALLDIKLNFFNMLALPAVIGMGIDDGIHMYHRHKELGPGSPRYIVGTTGMAAVLTTLTTAIGFGSLMTANHYGLNSLGFLTTVGMAVALATTLIVLPAALRWSDDRQAARKTAEP